MRILTYCSRSYRPCLSWVLPSWDRPDIQEILVATDFPPEEAPRHAKIRAFQAFPPSDNWVEHTSRKAAVAARYLPDGLVAFLDLDCWIRGNLSDAFGAPNTISVTRFWSKEVHTGGTITSGAWYANVSDGVRQFMRQWEAETEARYAEHASPGATTSEQYVFTELCRKSFRTGVPCGVNTIPESLWNCEHSDTNMMVQKARANAAIVLHFKGGTWRDAEHVKAAIEAAEGK